MTFIQTPAKIITTYEIGLVLQSLEYNASLVTWDLSIDPCE